MHLAFFFRVFALASAAILLGCPKDAEEKNADVCGGVLDGENLRTSDPGAAEIAAEPAEKLGLNDITWLYPAPTPTNSSSYLSATDIDVPQQLLQCSPQLLRTSAQTEVYSAMQVVALRFDLCDRSQPAVTCDANADGVLRVVLQPNGFVLDREGGGPPGMGEVRFQDAAVHVFFRIGRGTLSRVALRLRQLATLQHEPVTSPLQVSPGLAQGLDGAYAQALKTLVKSIAVRNNLIRMTFFAQLPEAALGWIFGGFDRKDNQFVAKQIPGIDRTRQEVEGLGVGATFEASPHDDVLEPISLVLDGQRFAASNDAERRTAMHTLRRLESPDIHTAETVACASCHLARPVAADRALRFDIDYESLADGYKSSYNLAVSEPASVNTNSLRALGWDGQPIISKRVVQETAQVLHELERRFPRQP